MRTKSLLLGAVASLLALSSCGPASSQAPINPPRAAPASAPVSFADIVERVAPAVVSIETRRQVPVRLPTFPGFPFELFPTPRNTPPPVAESTAEGSGFFISADGYIVTNNHVVEGAEEITVTLRDQREFTARVVGRDEETDLAVLKVDGRNFPFVSFENAATPRVGDWVVAVGNPFGLGGSATAGIVSAHGRDIGEAYVDFIQIDAPINRGNSGGPTFDALGRVIGVNSIIVSPTGGNVGIGFAIPADVAQRVTRELIADGRVERGYIGAGIQTLEPDMAESLGLGDRKGVLVSDITPGGPAERAGLQSGDIVLSIDGRPVETSSALTRQVAATRPDERLRLEVLRGGARRTIEVRAGTRPSRRELAGLPVDPTAPTGSGPRLGVAVRALDPADRDRYRLPPTVRGALVESVERGSDAARKGLRAGDVIVRINDRPVGGPSDVAAAVEAARSAGRRNLLLFVHRDGRQLAVPVELMDAEGRSDAR